MFIVLLRLFVIRNFRGRLHIICQNAEGVGYMVREKLKTPVLYKQEFRDVIWMEEHIFFIVLKIEKYNILIQHNSLRDSKA